MWIWYLGEPDEAGQFRCEIAIRKRARDDEAEIRYSGRVHSIRIPPHRVNIFTSKVRKATVMGSGQARFAFEEYGFFCNSNQFLVIGL